MAPRKKQTKTERPTRIELVTWRDAFFDFDRKPDEAVRADYLVTTVGFVIHDGPVFLSLTQEVLPDDDGYRAVTNLPHEIIVERKVLQE